MTAILVPALLILLPTWALAAALLYWAAGTKLPRLARLLRRVALCWSVVLTAAFALGFAVSQTCGGDILYGFRACRILSDRIAGMVILATAIAYIAAALIVALLTVIGIVWEWRARRKP